MPEYLLTVREDDDGLFIRLPAEVAEELDASPGDRLSLSPMCGGFLLSSMEDHSTDDDGAMLSEEAGT